MRAVGTKSLLLEWDEASLSQIHSLGAQNKKKKRTPQGEYRGLNFAGMTPATRGNRGDTH